MCSMHQVIVWSYACTYVCLCVFLCVCPTTFLCVTKSLTKQMFHGSMNNHLPYTSASHINTLTHTHTHIHTHTHERASHRSTSDVMPLNTSACSVVIWLWFRCLCRHRQGESSPNDISCMFDLVFLVYYIYTHKLSPYSCISVHIDTFITQYMYNLGLICESLMCNLVYRNYHSRVSSLAA